MSGPPKALASLAAWLEGRGDLTLAAVVRSGLLPCLLAYGKYGQGDPAQLLNALCAAMLEPIERRTIELNGLNARGIKVGQEGLN